ncbi:MAG: hypothetical protein K0V04_19250 [Deltaproteobacteria bacterium]|nr:hypothetical protein [Deltaproteobacteria bacterium]
MKAYDGDCSVLMASGCIHSIDRRQPRRFAVHLVGDLGLTEAMDLMRQVLAQVDEIGDEARVVLDMTALQGCTTAARKQLVLMQRGLARRGCRTAYVSDRPRFRGMGLWLCHHADDVNGRAFYTMDQADAWLATGRQDEQACALPLRCVVGQDPGAVEP